VAVPEAAVDEDDGAVLGEDDVRRAGEAAVVDAVAEAELPEGATQEKLRTSVLGSVMRHTLKALLWSHDEANYCSNLHRFN
jgi:hypothetical protein